MTRISSSILILITIALSSVAAERFAFHMLGLPLIEGTGIYTDVVCLQDGSRTGTKAAAITNLAMLGTEGVLGVLSKTGVGNGKLTKVHKVSAFVLTAAGVWLAIQTSTDPKISGQAAQVTGLLHPALCTIPIFLYTF